jgi:signal transduction histidine kinase/CheY-like chemotaxis protein
MVIDPHELRRARAIATAAGLFSLTLGMMALAGWLSDSQMLKTGLTGTISLKANAAVGLCLAAFALLALLPEERPRAQTRTAQLAATLVALLGAVTLGEHLFDWDVGIDQLLFVEAEGEAATVSPGRMGPPACIGFSTLGLGLLFVDRRTGSGRAPCQWLSLPAMAFGTLGVLGHLTGATQLYGIARYTGIALPMALALLALSVGLFLARPTAAPASILVADNPGGQLARVMLPTTIGLPIVVGWLRTLGQKYGLYDTQFGRALLLLSLIVMFTAIVWRVALRLSSVATARVLAEQASSRAKAEAERLALENVQTLSVLDALLAHAPIGLVFFDRSRTCVRLNDYLARMQPAKRDSAVGRDLYEVLPGSGEGVAQAIERVFASGESTVDLELVSTAAAGEQDERSWLTGIFPVDQGRDEVSLAGAVIIDITERRRLEAQRGALLDSERAARSEAERAANLKDQFLATVSHELRTPLNAIMGWAVVAQRSANLPEALKRPLEIIVRNARAQAQLIHDLLDVSRIMSGKMKLEVEQVELANVIESALLAVRPAADAKQIELSASFQPSAGFVEADPARLQQILGNLLSNAIKFTPASGTVEVAIRRAGSQVEIAVSDQGAGIRPDFLPHVFDRFRQADASTTRRHGGLGLGLAIVKQLTELHGGSVRVVSAGENQGSTFFVTLPAASTRVSEPPVRKSLPDVSLLGVRVLVVDDEEDAREFMARVLADSHAEIELAAGVDQALDCLARGNVQLLISDIGMPGKDGYELIRQVRQRLDGDALPAIAVTAFARAEDRQRALGAGFQQHIAKPVDPYELTLAVASLVQRSTRRAAEGSPAVEG